MKKIKDLKLFLVKKDMTVKKLSEKAGVDRSYIYRLINDEIKTPSLEILQKISKALDVNINELVPGLEISSEQLPIDEQMLLDGYGELSNEAKKEMQRMLQEIKTKDKMANAQAG